MTARPLLRSPVRTLPYLMGLVLLVGCSGTVGPDDPLMGDVAPPASPNPDESAGNEDSPSGLTGSPSPSEGANTTSPGSANGTETTLPTGSGAPDAEEPAQPTDQCLDAPIDPGPAPLTRLTRRQYLNTLRDLLGELPDLNAAFSREDVHSGIGAARGDISQVEVEEFQRAAELVAPIAVAGDSLSRLAPCSADQSPRECAADFVRSFGSRAYRAPVTDPADVERHLVLFDQGATTDYRHGIELLLQGMLQSTRFLYRVEFGTSAPPESLSIPLTGYEVAARLSYAFLETLPNADLTEAAVTGKLATAEGVTQAVNQIMTSNRDGSPVQHFLRALILVDGISRVSKDGKIYPEWTPELQQAVTQQAERWFEELLANDAATLPSLLTSTTVLANDDLAFYYGVAAGDEFTEFEDQRAAGILTLPALLALNAKPDESSPVHRGKFVREMLLCQPPPAPPPDIPPAPVVDGSASTRERLNQHVADPACSGCHSLLDPVGFAFEHYDAIGRYRDADGNKPVDATGELIGAGDISGPLDGVVELGARLATSPAVEQCVTVQWFRHVFGRYETNADACTIQRLTEAFRTSGTDLNSLPRSIAGTDSFRYRRTIPNTDVLN